MKAKRNLWKRISIVLVFAILTTLGFLISCEKENIQPLNDNPVKSAQAEEEALRDINQNQDLCGEVERKALLIDNGKQVGFVFVYNDTKYYYVQVLALQGFYFKNAFLYTGTREALPLTDKGNLDFKSFNHIKESQDLIKTIRFKIPLEETHTNFVSSLMVQTNFGNDGRFALHRAWADGRSYGETFLGRVFSYEKNFCEADDSAEISD